MSSLIFGCGYWGLQYGPKYEDLYKPLNDQGAQCMTNTNIFFEPQYVLLSSI